MLLRVRRPAARSWLALDPGLPEAWDQLGQYQRLVYWDWAAADTSCQRVLELDRGNVDAIGFASTMKWTMGQLDDAMASERRMVALDPLNFDAQTFLRCAVPSA